MSKKPWVSRSSKKGRARRVSVATWLLHYANSQRARWMELLCKLLSATNIREEMCAGLRSHRIQALETHSFGRVRPRPLARLPKESEGVGEKRKLHQDLRISTLLAAAPSDHTSAVYRWLGQTTMTKQHAITETKSQILLDFLLELCNASTSVGPWAYSAMGLE
ncbi:hypothetical protein F5Y08DRAFT_334702 [Xylaria arbuscula]|nr:hypothetical protein F5Y08DRAFT_334702 [Xylaria arbuscula]